MPTVDDLNLSDLSLLKISIEDPLGIILKGAKKTIQACRPTILLKVSKEISSKVLSFTQEANYNLMHIQGDDYLALPCEISDNLGFQTIATDLLALYSNSK